MQALSQAGRGFVQPVVSEIGPRPFRLARNELIVWSNDVLLSPDFGYKLISSVRSKLVYLGR